MLSEPSIRKLKPGSQCRLPSASYGAPYSARHLSRISSVGATSIWWLKRDPKCCRMASWELREGIQMHIEQTQVQIERVEQAMEKLSVRPGRKVCEAMRGLVEEAQHEIEEQDEKGPILDLVIVAGMQRIEHYEIAAYGTGIALAEAVGEQEVADLLSETLEEEKQTDLKLTEVTQKAIMPAALVEEAGRL